MTKSQPELLAQLPLFADVSNTTLNELAQASDEQEYPAGTVLFHEGEQPEYLHILLDGSVQLTATGSDEREVVVEILQPIDTFITAAALTSQPYLMSAKVVDTARILLVPSKSIINRVAHDPQLGLSMIGSLSRQFRMMVRQLKDLRLRTSAQRLAVYFLQLAERGGHTDTITLPYDKKLIASRLGMTPENLSRSLANLRKHGIEAEHNAIHITDIEGLQAFCQLDQLLDHLEEQLKVLAE